MLKNAWIALATKIFINSIQLFSQNKHVAQFFNLLRTEIARLVCPKVLCLCYLYLTCYTKSLALFGSMPRKIPVCTFKLLSKRENTIFLIKIT